MTNSIATSDDDMARITRAHILEAFKSLPEDASTTTFRIARRLNCSEYRVRAAVSWLVLGGQLLEAGSTTRKDVHGRKYKAKLYCYGGDDEIFRVPQDPVDRRIARERRNGHKMNDFLYQRR